MASDLVVHLTANASKFNKGLSDATHGAKSFAGSVISLFNPLNMSFDSLIAKATAAGFSFYGIASRIDKLAGIADKAAQTGLSGEFLQKLAYAADQSGIPVDTLTSALEKMTLVLGKAEGDSEETAAALASIGLTSEALQAMSPDDQFLAIADAIGQLPTVAQRASASAAIFGKSMGEMGSLFADGKKGVSELMEEATKLKIGISNEDLASIAKADDAIDRMQSTMDDVLSKVTVELAPVFGQMADHLTAILPQIAELGKSISSAVGDSLSAVADIIESDVLPGVKSFLDTAADASTKWAAMPEKWKFLGEVIAAGVNLGLETIKAGWKQMITDLLDWTASKAKALVSMLNPRTAMDAVADWVNGQGERKTDMEGNNIALERAEVRFENLFRRLNGQEELPMPGDVKIERQGALAENEKERTRKMLANAGFTIPGAAGPGGKSPEVAATEAQTKALEAAFKANPPVTLSLVPEF